MRLDLRTGHLGDILLASPAMRKGDTVLALDKHRFPMEVEWGMDGDGVTGIPGGHVTEGWLRATGRTPERMLEQPHKIKGLIVIAPDVVDDGRRWGRWDELKLPAFWIRGNVPRKEWIELLGKAEVVICPNTGTAHMADALGAKVIGLYESRHTHTLPYWNSSYCIVRERLADIQPEDVLEQVWRIF